MIKKEKEEKNDKEKYNSVFLLNNLSDINYYEKLFRCKIEKQRILSNIKNSKKLKLVNKYDLNSNYKFIFCKQKKFYNNIAFNILTKNNSKRKNSILNSFQILFEKKKKIEYLFSKNYKFIKNKKYFK